MTGSVHSSSLKLRKLAQAAGLPVTPYNNTLTMLVRALKGQRAHFFGLIALAAADGSDDARKVLTVFSDLSRSEQASCNVDEVCLAAGVSPLRLISITAAIGYKANVDISDLYRSAAHPDIVAATIASAKRISGPHADIAQKDRQWLHEGAGFIPTQRAGVQITNQVNNSAHAIAAAAATGVDRHGVPSFLRDVTAVEGPRATIQRQITDAAPVERLTVGEVASEIIDGVVIVRTPAHAPAQEPTPAHAHPETQIEWPI